VALYDCEHKTPPMKALAIRILAIPTSEMGASISAA